MKMLIRALLVGIVSIQLLTGCQGEPDRVLEGDWKRYKTRFVAEDGRVIDTGNGGVSHSEGQGYGMIIAVKLNDKETFTKVWQWTRNNLQVRKDSLFMWRRRQGKPLADEDPNNATDGDLVIAWALLEAATKWQQPAYEQEAFKILDDVKRKLIVQNHGMTVILPGEHGFRTHDKIILNLSYWVYPALKEFSVRDPYPVWPDLIASGPALLQQARFGRWQLPPDWLEIGDDNAMAPAKKGRFGYDSVRVPLYLVFAGIDHDVLAPFAEYWTYYQAYTPAWIDLNENVMDSYGAGAGIKSIKQLTLAVMAKTRSATFGSIGDAEDYYSATLLLLSKLSYREFLKR